jgi:hypothetical protein
MSTNPFAESVIHLDAAQLDAVLDALDLAVEHLALCVNDEARTERYAALARQLRMEAGR